MLKTPKHAVSNISELNGSNNENEKDRKEETTIITIPDKGKAPQISDAAIKESAQKREEETKVPLKKVLGLRHIITVLRINLPREKTGPTIQQLEELLQNGPSKVHPLRFKK
jgi:hypothetical protein